MSLYGALFSGVSGLAAQSSAMGAISDNISNVNTTGYKGTKVNFNTLVTKQVSLTNYSPGGVQSKPRSSIDVQGLLQATNSSTDVAISGQGFFVVNEAGHPSDGDMFAYTRAGSFKVDKDGFLQNVSGWYMQGWPLMPDDGSPEATTQLINGTSYMKAYKGTTGSTVYINDNIVSSTHLQPLNLNEIGGTAAQTRNIRMGANLPKDAAIGKRVQQPITIYDSLGGSGNVQMTWTKTDTNKWDLQAYPPQGAKSLTLRDASKNAYASMGRLDFNGLPAAGGAFTTTINGHMWTFGASNGTDGAATNTLYTDPAAAGSTGTFVTNLSTDMNQAFQMEYDSQRLSGLTFPMAAGDTLTFGGQTFGGAGVTTMADLVTQINAQSTATGVNAFNNNGELILYSPSKQNVVLAGTGQFAPLDNQVIVGSGREYVTQLSGTNSILMNNFDSGNTLDVNGIQALLMTNGNPAIAQAGDPTLPGATPTSLSSNVSPSGLPSGITLTVGGVPTTINFPGPGTPTLSAVVNAINAQTGATGVVAALTNSSTITLNGITNQDVDVTATGFLSGFNGLTLNGNGFQLPAINIPNGQNANAIEFNGDGTPSAINVAYMSVDWANGSQDLTGSDDISLYLGDLNVSGGMTQLAGDYQLAYWNQDGAKFGNFAGVSIGTDGIVTALFDNGVTRPVFQIPVVTFVNPNGMESLTGNVFISTDNSGEPTLREAGSAGAGQVNAASLEASTVDIGEEFTTMIVTQRAYSAAAKIITTADQMLDELVQIKR